MRRTSSWSLAGSIAIFLVTGCSTLPARDPHHQTLFIGRMMRSHSGYDCGFAPCINGTASRGIQVALQNVATSVKSVIETQGDGLFFSSQLSPGDYIIKSYKYELSDQWGKMSTSSELGNNKFTISEGRVNNIGSILWQCDANEGCKYAQLGNYAAFRELVASAYPKSDWLNAQWTDVAVRK